MAEWTDKQREQFARHVAVEEERKQRQAETPEVGDLVETPDGRQWTVLRWATKGSLDLASERDEELHQLSRELVRVLRKA